VFQHRGGLFADLQRDAQLITIIREFVFSTRAQDPDLTRHFQLVSVVQARWGAHLALSSAGQATWILDTRSHSDYDGNALKKQSKLLALGLLTR
jgi:hypothetical protein